MNVSYSGGLNPTAADKPSAPRAALGNNLAGSDIRKNEKAARDFEAMLLTPVIDALQKTFAGDADGKTPGASDYRQMGTQALSQAIAARGGFGIADMVLHHLRAPKVSGGG
jgi:Rod binding domain-containing protein